GFTMDGGVLAVHASLQSSTTIGADARLDGALEVSLPAGERATWGKLYTLARLDATDQSFDHITLPALPKPWLQWDVRQTDSSQLIAEVTNRADFNRDGKIDFADRDLWSSSFGSGDQADANGDGITDGA